jgi:glucan phosphoethanolaminetransferase (alkaline phosphatase superfamily)
MEDNFELEIKQNSELKRSVWWKIYFFIFVFFYGLGIVLTLAEPKSGIIEYIGIVTTVILAIGLYGFVFLKPIFKPKFWLLVLITDVVFSVIHHFNTNIDLKMDISDSIYYVSYAIALLVSMPAYFALYFYSKPSGKV